MCAPLQICGSRGGTHPQRHIRTEGLVYDRIGLKPPVARFGADDYLVCEALEYASEAPCDFVDDVAREVELRPGVQEMGQLTPRMKSGKAAAEPRTPYGVGALKRRD